jgi:hypothetical protein
MGCPERDCGKPIADWEVTMQGGEKFAEELEKIIQM